MKNLISTDKIEQCIHRIRGKRVIVAADLAKLYGVVTWRLNEQVKRNKDRFPEDFMFQLTPEEDRVLTSQFARSKPGRGGRRRLPYAFTEHGALMAANVLNSRRAVQMSVFVVRAFIRMRAALTDSQELAHKLVGLEEELKGRLNVHEAAIVTILQRVMDIIDPPTAPLPKPPKVGFTAKEPAACYGES